MASKKLTKTFRDRQGYNGVKIVDGKVRHVWVGNFHEGGIAYVSGNPRYGTLQEAFDKLFFFNPILHQMVLNEIYVPGTTHLEQVQKSIASRKRRLTEDISECEKKLRGLVVELALLEAKGSEE